MHPYFPAAVSHVFTFKFSCFTEFGVKRFWWFHTRVISKLCGTVWNPLVFRPLFFSWHFARTFIYFSAQWSNQNQMSKIFSPHEQKKSKFLKKKILRESKSFFGFRNLAQKLLWPVNAFWILFFSSIEILTEEKLTLSFFCSLTENCRVWLQVGPAKSKQTTPRKILSNYANF